jgi:hypothetical protein
VERPLSLNNVEHKSVESAWSELCCPVLWIAATKTVAAPPKSASVYGRVCFTWEMSVYVPVFGTPWYGSVDRWQDNGGVPPLKRLPYNGPEKAPAQARERHDSCGAMGASTSSQILVP